MTLEENSDKEFEAISIRIIDLPIVVYPK